MVLISGSLGLALYLGVGSDYKDALGILATGPFIAISPEGTLFGTIPALLTLARDSFSSFLRRPPTIQEVWAQLKSNSSFAGSSIIRIACVLRCGLGSSTFLVPLHLSNRSVDGFLSAVQSRRDKEGSGQMHEVSPLRGALPNADQHSRPALGEIQRPRVHNVHGMRGRLSARLA